MTVYSNVGTKCLGAFAKLREATICYAVLVCLSVRLSIRIEQLGSHLTGFHVI